MQNSSRLPVSRGAFLCDVALSPRRTVGGSMASSRAQHAGCGAPRINLNEDQLTSAFYNQQD